jgi:urease accessory protein
LNHLPAYIRAAGELRADFQRAGSRTQAMNIFETGGLRLRCPRVAQGCEGVIINTGGGIAGGDRASYDFEIGAAAQVTLTTQSAEKIYRAQADAAQIDVVLRVAAQAQIEWLPQETILFDGAHLQRRLDVDMDETSSLTMLESVVYGRIAMGETQLQGSLRDRWRIRRNRRLLFAEDMRIDGDMTGVLDRPALGNGARASALFVHIAPDAEARLEAVRQVMADAACEWGASAFNGMLVLRLLSPSPENMRSAIVRLLQDFRGRMAPRVWQ